MIWRIFAWGLIGVIVAASWPWAIFLGCAYGLFRYLRQSNQPPATIRRRVVNERRGRHVGSYRTRPRVSRRR
jgi:hypothetical protein